MAVGVPEEVVALVTAMTAGSTFELQHIRQVFPESSSENAEIVENCP